MNLPNVVRPEVISHSPDELGRMLNFSERRLERVMAEGEQQHRKRPWTVPVREDVPDGCITATDLVVLVRDLLAAEGIIVPIGTIKNRLCTLQKPSKRQKRPLIKPTTYKLASSKAGGRAPEVWPMETVSILVNDFMSRRCKRAA